MPSQPNPDDPEGFDHRFAEVNGIRLHYVEKGSGPLVILVHGFPFLWYLWRHQIRPVAAAGYRVVALDTRGYGQSGTPDAVSAYDMSWLVGDMVGLMKALGEETAVLWARTGVRRSSTTRRSCGRTCSAEAEPEIMRDLRGYLLGIFYSTSASCPAAEQWRWVWQQGERFSDTYTVPAKLPGFLSQQALDYYVENFQRTGIKPSLNYYTCIQRSWEISSFLDGATVPQPAVFAYGESDPSTQPQFGIDRQGPALRALKDSIPKLQGIIKMPGVGHTPPEEQPADATKIILDFLATL